MTAYFFLADHTDHVDFSQSIIQNHCATDLPE